MLMKSLIKYWVFLKPLKTSYDLMDWGTGLKKQDKNGKYPNIHTDIETYRDSLVLSKFANLH